MTGTLSNMGHKNLLCHIPLYVVTKYRPAIEFCITRRWPSYKKDLGFLGMCKEASPAVLITGIVHSWHTSSVFTLLAPLNFFFPTLHSLLLSAHVTILPGKLLVSQIHCLPPDFSNTGLMMSILSINSWPGLFFPIILSITWHDINLFILLCFWLKTKPFEIMSLVFFLSYSKHS